MRTTGNPEARLATKRMLWVPGCAAALRAGAAPTRSGAGGSEFRGLVLDDYYLHYGQRDAGAEPEAYLETDVGETRLNLQSQLANGGFLPRPRPEGALRARASGLRVGPGCTGGIGSATY